MTLLSFALDIVLIALLLGAITFAIKLTQQLAGLRQSRVEMERFIAEFSAQINRAEAGVRGLKQAARSGGDDLEQLIDKASALRDEMTFLIDSADQASSRLTTAIAKTAPARAAAEPASTPDVQAASQPKVATVEKLRPVPLETPSAPSSSASAASGAERELLRVLGKLK